MRRCKLFSTLVDHLFLRFAMALSNIEFVDITEEFKCQRENPTALRVLCKGYTVRITFSDGRILDDEVQFEACGCGRNCYRFLRLEWLSNKVFPADPVPPQRTCRRQRCCSSTASVCPVCCRCVYIGRFERPWRDATGRWITLDILVLEFVAPSLQQVLEGLDREIFRCTSNTSAGNFRAGCLGLREYVEIWIGCGGTNIERPPFYERTMSWKFIDVEVSNPVPPGTSFRRRARY